MREPRTPSFDATSRLLRRDLDSVDERVVRYRDKGKQDLSLRCWRDSVDRFGDGPAMTICEDVEVLKKTLPVAVDVENAASYAAGSSVLLSEPCLAKIQGHAVLTANGSGQRVLKGTDATGAVEPKTGTMFLIGGLSVTAATEVAIREPDVSGVVLKMESMQQQFEPEAAGPWEQAGSRSH